ncbi:hypothetical protein H4R20_003811 [Coemansia guatemalensis]|uniref:J domain-containing protein n=1 Tax=Coemansia guatemalensis TaxID=2761395 RepID=A0A9W8LSB5_9FUNG|nr:hypothetical protein H4R20_003811 [Coemansia guatemalensis]
MAKQSSEFTSILGWLLLPQLAANYLLKITHWILQQTAPRLVPHPKTPQYTRHRRIAYVVVVASYLLYTLWATEQALGANFYHVLGLRPDSFSASQLRRNFRRLSLILHPDKNPEGEEQFILLQNAYTVLSDPLARFVYDHAGESAVKCQACKSISDYMLASIPSRLASYAAYILGSVAMQVFRIGKYGTYWRYVAIGTFAALDLAMMTSTTDPLAIRVLLWLAPHRTSFEIAQILRQTMVCCFIALNQIGPQFIPHEKNVNTVALAKELLQKTKTTNIEILGKAVRLASFYKDTGLQRHMTQSFEDEMKLGMTIGTSRKFCDEYTDRLNTERDKIKAE